MLEIFTTISMEPVEMDQLTEKSYYIQKKLDAALQQENASLQKENASLRQQLEAEKQRADAAEQKADAAEQKADAAEQKADAEGQEHCEELFDKMVNNLRDKAKSLDAFNEIWRKILLFLQNKELFLYSEKRWKCIATGKALEQMKELLKLIPAMLPAPLEKVDSELLNAFRSRDPLVCEFLRKFTFDLVGVFEGTGHFIIPEKVFKTQKGDFREMMRNSSSSLHNTLRGVSVLIQHGNYCLIAKASSGGYRILSQKLSSLKEPRGKKPSNLRSPSFVENFANALKRMAFSNRSTSDEKSESELGIHKTFLEEDFETLNDVF